LSPREPDLAESELWDVVVIGGGNAGLAAALTAARLTDRVLVLDRGAAAMRGGNTRHTRNIRCVHGQADRYSPGTYLFEELWRDLCGVGTGPSNEKLAELTVRESETVPQWMTEHGARWQPPLTGTLHLGRTNRFFLGGGKALINTYHRTAAHSGITVRYGITVEDLVLDGDRCTAVVTGAGTLRARAVVCASGGFEANIAWLRRYWGDAADNYLIRGSRDNDGRVLAALYEHGAARAGEERGFHSVDCRACYHACMYAPPHEFAVDPPTVLTAVRLASYRHYLPPAGWPRPGWWPARNARAAAAVLVVVALLALVATTEGIGALLRHGSPYQAALLVTVLLPTVWSAAVMVRALAAYWHDVHGPLRDLADWRALATAVGYAARLEYLRSGGAECPYPGDDPSPARRRLHTAVAGGFALCFAATVAAAFLQDVMGVSPPYPLLSAPVILGTAGGIGMLAGCAGLFALKRRSDPAPGVADYGLLLGLGLLALTGLLTLLLRATPAFGLILVTHLATIVVCFGLAPYTRVVHAG
jgi:CitB-like protein